MPYLRRLPKLPPSGRVTVRLSPVQRDQLLASPALPRSLGHLIHRAPVRDAKLQVRVTRDELDAFITAAIQIPTPTPQTARALDIFLSYLETQADRFAERPDET